MKPEMRGVKELMASKMNKAEEVKGVKDESSSDKQMRDLRQK